MEQIPTQPYARWCPSNPYARELASIPKEMYQPVEPKLLPLLGLLKAIYRQTTLRKEPEPKPPSEFMTTEEVAELVSVSTKTIRRWVALGNVFPFVPLPGSGHGFRFLRTSVMEWARKSELGNSGRTRR
jgi:excisionase family DNA binding protein